MTCPTTARPNHPTPPTAKPTDANPSTGASGPSPASTPASPSALGSATTAAAPTSSAAEMIAQAARLARQPAPIASLLYSSLEWYAARPGKQPTPLRVQMWIEQADSLVRQYRELLCQLVEVQVQTLDAHWKMNSQLFTAAEEMLGGEPIQEDCTQ